jgi:hypothetical protein
VIAIFVTYSTKESHCCPVKPDFSLSQFITR